MKTSTSERGSGKFLISVFMAILMIVTSLTLPYVAKKANAAGSNRTAVLTGDVDESSYMVDEKIYLTFTLTDAEDNPLGSKEVSITGFPGEGKITFTTYNDGTGFLYEKAALNDSTKTSEEITLNLEFAGDEDYDSASCQVKYTVQNFYQIEFNSNPTHGGYGYYGQKTGSWDSQTKTYLCEDSYYFENPGKGNMLFFDGIYFAKIVDNESYQFLGWDPDPDATVPTYRSGDSFVNLTNPGKTLTLYAIWKKPYTVDRIDAKITPPVAGNTPSTEVSITTQPEGAYIKDSAEVWWYKAPAPSYDYSDWTEMATGEVFEEDYYYLCEIYASCEEKLSESVTGYVNDVATDENFYPCYSRFNPYGADLFHMWYVPVQHTVTFEMNGHGTALDAQKVADGSKATKPTDPTESGWTFEGWYTDDTLQTAFDFDTAITADTTVYAKWKEEPIAITYTIVSGGNSTWTKDSDETVTITVKRDPDDSTCFSHFADVVIDDDTLTKGTDYTAVPGSTVITFSAATLQKLSDGTHNVTVNFDDGKVASLLTIKPGDGGNGGNTPTPTPLPSPTPTSAPTSTPTPTPTPDGGNNPTPKTGDTGNQMLWGLLLVAIGTMLIGTTLYSRKRKNMQ